MRWGPGGLVFVRWSLCLFVLWMLRTCAPSRRVGSPRGCPYRCDLVICESDASFLGLAVRRSLHFHTLATDLFIEAYTCVRFCVIFEYKEKLAPVCDRLVQVFSLYLTMRASSS